MANQMVGIRLVNVDYSAIEILVGARYYQSLNQSNDSKLFFNLGYIFRIGLASKVDYEDGLGDLEIKKLDMRNFTIGIGYKYKSKYSLECRFDNQDLLTQYLNWKTNYSTASIILGFTF